MPFTQALCPLMQKSLESVAGQNAGYLHRQQTGFLDAVTSQENRRSFDQIEVGSGVNGGRRMIEITFVQPSNVLTDIVVAQPNLCTAPTREKTPFADLIDPANMLEAWTSSLQLCEEELAKICFASTDQYRADMIMSEMDALAVFINRTLITTYSTTLVGDFYNSTNAPQPVQLVTAGPPVSADPGAWSIVVKNALRNIGVTGKPIVVGGAGLAGTGIATYVDLLAIGCCNDQGIDLSKANGQMYYFYDQDFDAFSGNGNFTAFAPGALQLITFNKYGGPASNPRRSRVPGVYEKDTIIDPFTGLEYDFKLIYDNCTECWTLTMGLAYLLWALPINMYPAGSPMNGVRNSLMFTAV